jgi:riboflavin biosynthesis pyrimidine reductase
MQLRETEERIRAIYGDVLTDTPGVLHVASVWCDGAGDYFALRIGAGTPRSATDVFSLALARARCDAIVTTGRILREEPGLRHALPVALAHWRRERLAKTHAPVSVVLTRRSDLDLAHPLVAPGREGEAFDPGLPRQATIVVTAPAAAAALRARVAAAGDRAGTRVPVEAVGLARPGLRELLTWLRDERGFASACVEAGPSTARDLYDEPLAVDELMLSQLHVPALPVGVCGGAFADLARIERRFALASEHESDEESGRWSFRRLLRRGAFASSG